MWHALKLLLINQNFMVSRFLTSYWVVPPIKFTCIFLPPVGAYIDIMFLVIASHKFSGGQTCLNNPNVNQRGQKTIASGRQVIVPNARFNCNGRITNVAVSMHGQISSNHPVFPVFQVWHPTQLNSSTYNKTDEVKLTGGTYIKVDDASGYFYANISLNNGRIEFQSGDVIGYYQPSSSRRYIWSVQTSGYTSYSNTVTTSLTSVDINSVENIETNHQPLIKVMFGKSTQ